MDKDWSHDLQDHTGLAWHRVNTPFSEERVYVCITASQHQIPAWVLEKQELNVVEEVLLRLHKQFMPYKPKP